MNRNAPNAVVRQDSWRTLASKVRSRAQRRGLAGALRTLLLVLVLVSHAPRAEAQAEASLPATESAAANTLTDTPAAAPSTEDLARARQLFQRGVALAEQHQFGAAAQRFRDALAIRPAAAVEYNLAAALFEIGRYDESFNRAQNVKRDPEAPEALRERAEKLSRSLYPHTARLTVTASSSTEEDVVVRVDSEALDPSLMGVARAVSPGAHRIVAEREGASISEREVQVPIRTAVIIDVSLIIREQMAPQPLAVQTESVASVSTRPEPSQRDDNERRRRRIRLYCGIAAGIVAISAGVALAIVLTKDEPKQKAGASGDFMPGVLTWN